MNWLKPIPENIPDEMKAMDQWVCWKAVYLPEKDKWTKVPYDSKTNKKAKSNDPNTWGSFDKAWKAFQAGGFGYTGIGFELSASDPFCGWDLDHCRDPETGKIKDWGEYIIQKLNSYTEISPSGTGLRIICKASLPPGGRKKGNVEVYQDGRYLTITGNQI